MVSMNSDLLESEGHPKDLSEFFVKSGLKQKFVAKHLGITEQYLARLKSGDAAPSRALAKKLNEFTKIPLERLLYPGTA